MTDLLSLDQLRTFLTIAESKSFTRAAERLYRSQPALSMQIKALEKQLGAELLVRSGRETTLTEAGRVLAGYARRILDINEEALAKLAVVDMAGSVRVGVLEEAALGPLFRVLTRFGRLCTRIRIELEVSTSRDLARRIESNELCLAVANSSFAKAPVEPLWHERYVWACSQDYEPAEGEPLQLIVDSLDYPCASRDAALKGLEERGIQWQVVFCSLSLPALQAAVRARLGVAILPESALLPEMRVLTDRPEGRQSYTDRPEGRQSYTDRPEGRPSGAPSPDVSAFPAIPSAEIALYRGDEATSPASESLYSFLLENLRSGDAPAAIA